MKGYYNIHQQDSTGNAKLGIVPNNISSKPTPYNGALPQKYLDFDKRGAQSTDGASGFGWVYLIEFLFLVGLVLLFIFLVLPKMKESFEKPDGSYNSGLVMLCSIAYFFGLGITEMWVIEPVFVKVFVHASRNSKTDMTPVHIA